MGLEGDIETFPISAVGRMIHEERKSGILRVLSGRHVTRFYFRDGGIVFISGDLTADWSLGALLKDGGLVSEAQIQESLPVARKTHKRLGVVLLEKGHVTKQGLVQTLHRQFKEAVAMVLSWGQGRFVYQDGLNGFVEDIHLEMDPIRLVAEAEKWKTYRRWIPNDRVVFQIAEGMDRSRAVSSEGALRVMLLIDGRRNVSQIVKQTGLSRLAVYRAITSLADQGAIVRYDDGAGVDKTIDRDTALAFFLQLLDALVSDIQLDIGRNKAVAVMNKALEGAAEREPFLKAVDTGSDMDLNRRRFCETSAAISMPVIVKAFKRVIVYFLRETDRVLGSRSTRDILIRLLNALETSLKEQTVVALEMTRFLNRIGGEQALFRETGSLLDPRLKSSPTAEAAERRSFNALKHIDGGMIIAFYGAMIQSLMRQMRNDIGQQANTLFDEVCRESEYYEQFLSQLKLTDDMQANVQRIRDHIARKGYRLSKKSFVSGFQLLLIGLLNQRMRLLGAKAMRRSIDRIRTDVLNHKQPEFKAIGTHLLATLEAIYAKDR